MKIFKVIKYIFIICILIIILAIIFGNDNTNNEQNMNNNSNTTDNNTVYSQNNSNEVEIDYLNAKVFEDALNAGENVEGKIVKFSVVEYHPDSVAGYNAWAGEHLNFISTEDLKLKKDDNVVGKVTSVKESCGSWYINYDVINIEEVQNNSQQLDTNTNENNTTNTDTNSEIIEQSSSSKYEKAFIRDLPEYDLYFLFDTDTKEAIYFSTSDGYVMNGIYSGEFSTGIDINWVNDGWHEKFTYKEGETTAILVDGNGFNWEYETCNVSEAERILNNL